MSFPNKKAKMDVAAVAWEHYRNFLDSQQDDNEEGDVDELVELLEILTPSVEPSGTAADFSSVHSLLPVLCSVAHCHLADCAINSSVDQETNGKDDAGRVTHHLQSSLRYFRANAATWSMGANYARMTQRASPAQICAWYRKAATCASTLRKTALSLLEGPNDVDDRVKEWIELLLMDSVVGAEYVEDEEAQLPSADRNENDKDADGDNDDDDDDDDEEKDSGYFSSSSVEATSRFMAAMLLSILGKHDEAREQLKGFQLTHRLHPNVWTATRSRPQPVTTKLSLQEPYLFPCEALPVQLYTRLCQVLAPDASYWKESDYAHRGYYSYFMDIIDVSKPPTNLVDAIIVHHLLPRAQHVVTSAGSNDKIVGAEWWPHTRPIQANLGHQLHFDTDEALLEQEGKITHPILSSVLYLTGNNANENIDANPAGATVIFKQTSDSNQVAEAAWKSFPQNNSFIVFPGNLLHGVLPCPGEGYETKDTAVDAGKLQWDEKLDTSKNDEHVKHRLTFMVGFWTRRVPDKMKERRLYGPCGPLPPATDEHSWVKEIQKGYPRDTNGESNGFDAASLEVMSLPKVAPAWESIATDEETNDDPPLELPRGIDHRFFVRGAPECFRESLFQKDQR